MIIFLPLFHPQSIVNVKPDNVEETEEEKEQKHKTFVEKYEKQIKHFGMYSWHLFTIVLYCILHWVSVGENSDGPSLLSLLQVCCDAGMTARSTCLTTPI